LTIYDLWLMIETGTLEQRMKEAYEFNAYRLAEEQPSIINQ